MRILFVRPSISGVPSRDTMAPLCFAILDALTPRDVETTLLDERLEPIDTATPGDLVAMTVETYTARRAYQLAAHFRGRDLPVVMGGHHPSLLPEEALAHADAVVIGDAEALWPRVVEDARRGRLQAVYRQAEPPDLDGPMPRRRLFRGKPYLGLTLVQTGRGCRYHCEFCSIHALYGPHLRQRPVGEVVEEIRRTGGRDVFFVDDNLFSDVASARALFEALLPLRIRWSCQVSVDVTRDRDLVRLMARSGCATALVGFESLDPANLRQMRKSWSLRHGGAADTIRTLREAGIMVYGTFVFGYDADTPASFDATAEFALRQGLFLANFNPLTPTPGAKLYDRLRDEGRLIHERWWLDPSYRYGDATFHPRGMSAAALADGCYRARMRFYSGRSIARRLVGSGGTLHTPRRVAVYMTANLISRREIRAKQGRALGAPADAAPTGAGV